MRWLPVSVAVAIAIAIARAGSGAPERVFVRVRAGRSGGAGRPRSASKSLVEQLASPGDVPAPARIGKRDREAVQDRRRGSEWRRGRRAGVAARSPRERSRKSALGARFEIWPRKIVGI